VELSDSPARATALLICCAGYAVCFARTLLLWHRAMKHRERGVGGLSPLVWVALTPEGVPLRNRGFLYMLGAIAFGAAAVVVGRLL
jgi:hypothetical protein